MNFNFCSIWNWPWPTIWTAVAALGAWAAVLVYYRTLKALTSTLDVSIAQTRVANAQADAVVFSEIFSHIGTKELRKARHETIYAKDFNYAKASESKKQGFRDVMVAYNRAALIATTDSHKARLLNLHSDGIWQLVKNHCSGIRFIRNPTGNDIIPMHGYGRALEDLWNWAVNNKQLAANWNSHWPDRPINIDRQEGC